MKHLDSQSPKQSANDVAYVLVVAARFRDRLAGLLVPRPPNCLLLIAPCSSIHTFGMRFCIDVAFFDSQAVVLRTERNVAPGRVLRCSTAVGVMERKANQSVQWFSVGEEVSICMQAIQQ